MGIYKLLAFDLDGTLLDSNSRILESSRAAIAEARKQGVRIVLVTGRHHTATHAYHYELGLDTPAICCNGTYIMEFQGHEPVYSNPLPREQARGIINIARDMGMHTLMYVQDAMLLEHWNDHTRRLQLWSDQLPEPVRPVLKAVDDFMEEVETAGAIYKFVLSHPDRPTFQAAISKIEESIGVSCERSWEDRVDIANSGNSKGNALIRLAQQWRIAPQEILAVGDNDNDISMIRQAGLGVAMGNCTEKLREVADLKIGGNNENSIAQMLEQYVFK